MSVCNLIRIAAHCSTFMYVLERKFWCRLSYVLLILNDEYGLGWDGVKTS